MSSLCPTLNRSQAHSLPSQMTYGHNMGKIWTKFEQSLDKHQFTLTTALKKLPVSFAILPIALPSSLIVPNRPQSTHNANSSVSYYWERERHEEERQGELRGCLRQGSDCLAASEASLAVACERSEASVTASNFYNFQLSDTADTPFKLLRSEAHRLHRIKLSGLCPFYCQSF